MRIDRRIVIGIIVIVAIVLVLRGCHSSSPLPDVSKTPSEVAVKVITQPLSFSENAQRYETVGTGRAQHSVDIYPAVAEEVSDVLFTSQQRVEANALLVQLDDREETLAVELAQVRLQQAEAMLQRFEQAVKKGAVPQSEVDTARADFEAAKVALDQAKLALAERQIRAPFAGVVGIAQVDPGDRVATDTLITGLDNREHIYVDFDIPEALAGTLQQREQPTVQATTPSFPNRIFEGRIIASENRIAPERRTLQVRASIANADDMLRPGMSFTIRWDISGDSYATVPEIALQWGRDGAYLWVIREGKAEKVIVQVVARIAGRVLLDGALKENEPVVVEGVQRLRPGVAVEQLEQPAS